jgi:glycosyltransferase involved in cell wall biosynthesis
MNAGDIQELLGRIRSGLSTLRVLGASWEGGNVCVLAEDGTRWTLSLGKAGGMGVVAPQLPLALKRCAQGRNLDWSFASVSPLFSDIVAAEREGEVLGIAAIKERGLLKDTGHAWTIRYADRDYPVKLWEAQVEHPTLDCFVSQYLLEQPDLWGTNNLAFLPKPGGRKTEPDLYEVPLWRDRFPANTTSPFVSSPYSMAQFQRIRYLVFARSVARLYYGGQPTATETVPVPAIPQFQVLIGHDFHAGLAVFFEEPQAGPVIQLSVGHNFGYQGIDSFYSPNRRGANVNCTERQNWAFLKVEYARLLGLTPQQVDDYFLAWANDTNLGTPNWTQAVLRRNYQLTGLATTTVSPGYADEQKLDRDGVLLAAGKQNDGAAYEASRCRDRLLEYFHGNTQQDDLFVPNQNLADLQRYRVVGVLNGMRLEETHLLHSPELRSLLDSLTASDQVKRLDEFWSDYQATVKPGGESVELARKFDEAAESLDKIKARAKERLFEAPEFKPYFAGRPIDQAKPLLFAWGRLVSQKAFHVIHEAVTSAATRSILDEALVVVLASAPSGDIEAIEVECRLRAVNHPNFVFVNKFDGAFRDACLLAAVAALQTSRFEPCGLTDVEAYWSGTPCVVHEIGGFIKGLRDFEMYTHIAENYPQGEPVAESYQWFDNTRPREEAVAFVRACRRLLAWTPTERRRRQLKALTLTQFTYGIPENRYIDLIQFVWLNQAWRWLKDHGDPDAVSRAANFIEGQENGFVPGDGQGCCRTLGQLYRAIFVPPAQDIGVQTLDHDMHLDRRLCTELARRATST